MSGFDVASAYNAAPAGQGPAPADPSQGQSQDLTVPGDVAAQIAQAIQGNDCQTVCKLMASVISAGQGQ